MKQFITILAFSISISAALATIYYIGEEVTQDYKKAKELYEKAIEKGHSFASYLLANLYLYGHGVQQDYNKVRELYEYTIDRSYDSEVINDLTSLYCTTELKTDRAYVINYFLKICEADKLNAIYGYTDYDIKIFKELNNLKQQIIEQKEQIEHGKSQIAEYEAHIMATPDGELYFEMREDWETNVKNIHSKNH